MPGEGAEKSIFHGESRGHLKGKTLDARLLSAPKKQGRKRCGPAASAVPETGAV
jgi:hypothetical protein